MSVGHNLYLQYRSQWWEIAYAEYTVVENLSQESQHVLSHC